MTYVIIRCHYICIIRTLYIWLSRIPALLGPWCKALCDPEQNTEHICSANDFVFFKILVSLLGGSISETSRDYRKNGFIMTVWLYGKISLYVYILHRFYLVKFPWTEFSYLARLFSFSSWDTSELIDRNTCYLPCKLSRWGQ